VTASWPCGPIQSLPGHQGPLAQGRITSRMREGVLSEGPGTGAKSSYSQGTRFFCPVKSSLGSRQGKEGKTHSYYDTPSSKPHCRKEGEAM
jgi:hypothetical protein